MKIEDVEYAPNDFFICCECKISFNINVMRAVVEKVGTLCLGCFHENFTDNISGEA